MKTIEVDDDTYRALEEIAKRTCSDTIGAYLAKFGPVATFLGEEEIRVASKNANTALKAISGLDMKMPEKIAHVLYHLQKAAPFQFNRKMEGFRKEHGNMIYISRHPDKMVGWDSAKVHRLGNTEWYFNAALSESDTKEFFERICRELTLSPSVKAEIGRIMSEKPKPFDISDYI